jgi:hypothetical protein
MPYIEALQRHLARVGYIETVLPDGHSTKDQLKKGVGKRGNPTSGYSVMCDQMCTNLKALYFAGTLPLGAVVTDEQVLVGKVPLSGGADLPWSMQWKNG